jgi:hypothetical protein
MYLEHSRSQQCLYKDSLLYHLDSSSLNSPCSTFAFLLSLAWLLIVTAQAGFFQLMKGGELLLYKTTLQAAHITELKEQLVVMTKRKIHKLKQIQHDSTMEYGKAAAQVATEASIAAKQSKKTHGSSDQERAQPTA